MQKGSEPGVVCCLLFSFAKKNMEKIRYRLVWNRKNTLNRQGCALVQIEAKLNKRNVYFSTKVYLKPEHWDKTRAQVVTHPHSTELNALLFEQIIYLQGVELSFWKRGLQPTLSLLRESVARKVPVDVTFTEFARKSIANSDKRDSTKENLTSTVRILDRFRQGITFEDINYSFLKDFEQWLREQGKNQSTVGKHLRQLRTIVNEAICEGYMTSDAYPFRKFKIKIPKNKKEFLTPDELSKLEKLNVTDTRQRHILDAFLFCCYTGLRFSDFRALTTSNFTIINRKKWLCLKMQKTNIEIKLPLELLFDGKAIEIISRYESVEAMAEIPINADTNKILSEIVENARIRKKVTFHTARHTCATILIYKGVPITTVQKLLGHTSVKTTEIYSEILSNTIVRDLKAVKRKRIVNNFQNYVSIG